MINGLTQTFRWIFFCLLVFSFLGCAEWKYRRLESAELITSTQLRQNWNDYNVYYRPNAAILYKIKNDRKIKLAEIWIAEARLRVKENSEFIISGNRNIVDNHSELIV